MFPAAIPLGSIAGIRLRAHWSVLVILTLLSEVLALVILPQSSPDLDAGYYWVTGVLTSLCLLGSLLAHELAHSLIARHYGMRVTAITLWMLGGVSELEDQPPSPRADLLIALAGPVTSLLAGGGFWFAAHLLHGSWPLLLLGGLLWLAVTNVIIGVFNLLPGAPLDGGHAVRAVVWWRTGDRARADAIAANAGRALGFCFVAFGLFEVLFVGWLSWLWLALIGWFLITASRAELVNSDLRRSLEGLTAGDVMRPATAVAGTWLTIDDFLQHTAATIPKPVYPVVSVDCTPVGIVRLTDLATLPTRRRQTAKVADVAVKPPLVSIVDVNDPLADVIGKARRRATDVVLVTEDSRLAGLMEPADLATTTAMASLGFRRAGTP